MVSTRRTRRERSRSPLRLPESKSDSDGSSTSYDSTSFEPSSSSSSDSSSDSSFHRARSRSPSPVRPVVPLCLYDDLNDIPYDEVFQEYMKVLDEVNGLNPNEIRTGSQPGASDGCWRVVDDDSTITYLRYNGKTYLAEEEFPDGTTTLFKYHEDNTCTSFTTDQGWICQATIRDKKLTVKMATEPLTKNGLCGSCNTIYMSAVDVGGNLKVLHDGSIYDERDETFVILRGQVKSIPKRLDEVDFFKYGHAVLHALRMEEITDDLPETSEGVKALFKDLTVQDLQERYGIFLPEAANVKALLCGQ